MDSGVLAAPIAPVECVHGRVYCPSSGILSAYLIWKFVNDGRRCDAPRVAAGNKLSWLPWPVPPRNIFATSRHRNRAPIPQTCIRVPTAVKTTPHIFSAITLNVGKETGRGELDRTRGLTRGRGRGSGCKRGRVGLLACVQPPLPLGNVWHQGGHRGEASMHSSSTCCAHRLMVGVFPPSGGVIRLAWLAGQAGQARVVPWFVCQLDSLKHRDTASLERQLYGASGDDHQGG